MQKHNLTADEIENLQFFRAKVKAAELEQLNKKILKKLLIKWLKFSKKEGCLITFSTFVNDFDCTQYIPESLGDDYNYYFNKIKECESILNN